MVNITAQTCALSLFATQLGCLGCQTYQDALTVPEWFVDSKEGDDSKACTTPGSGACKTLGEPFRRIGRRGGTVLLSPTIHLKGNFSDETIIFMQASSTFPLVLGSREYNDANDIPYGSGSVLDYTPWDGTSAQEGIVTVEIDGVAIDTDTLTTANGWWLEVMGGPNAGLGVPIGDPRGPGVFATSGGSLEGSYTTAEPSAGDAVKLYRVTPIATAVGTYVEWSGGPMILRDVEIGNAQHSISIANLNGSVDGVEVDSCLLHGADIFQGAWLFSYGSSFTDGLRAYGRLVSTASTFDGLQARDNGELELADNTLVTTNGIWVGGRDGPGYAQIDGSTCVTSYAVPAIRIEDTATAYLSAPWWASHGSGAPAAALDVGAWLLYDVTPRCAGVCAESPWVVRGVGFSAVPATVNGIGIVQRQ